MFLWIGDTVYYAGKVSDVEGILSGVAVISKVSFVSSGFLIKFLLQNIFAGSR